MPDESELLTPRTLRQRIGGRWAVAWQSYLITARHIHDTVSTVDGLDDQSQKKVNFYTRQYIDALSPSNFAMTNPEVFRETVKSHGQMRYCFLKE